MVNEIEIEKYLEELTSKLGEATLLKRAEVSIGDWVPECNMCHHNVSQWCVNDPSFTPVRGWLYFDRLNKFVAHSVVLTPEGELFDITPSNAPREYPFLNGNLSEEGYEDLINGKGITELHIN
jgi:hypothetical protein